jgi:hypothetical protein
LLLGGRLGGALLRRELRRLLLRRGNLRVETLFVLRGALLLLLRALLLFLRRDLLFGLLFLFLFRFLLLLPAALGVHGRIATDGQEKECRAENSYALHLSRLLGGA